MMRAALYVLETRPAGRPECLFLGGDQIYADDVHADFLPLASRLGIALMGPQEKVPGLSPAGQSVVMSRKPFLPEFFTSTHMDHHLMTLGEYAATYLLAWNAELWLPRETFTQHQELWDGIGGAERARKALANITTYMIFDDHEITDDWFRTEKWREKAMGHEVTHRIIVNGLVAYWAFQAWGNAPDAYSTSFRELMQTFALTRQRTSEATASLLARGRWTFVAPTSPPTLFLDTRTGREDPKQSYQDKSFGISGFKAKAGLLTTLVPTYRHRGRRRA
jgi:hypothetical protein